jgi:DNA invertase Pin-like site-specific DNA recombinase
MISKIEGRHRQRAAYVYIRQSTLAQVRHHRESTERQYALRDKAIELGWAPAAIRILDRDLGVSGAQASNREDFKILVTEVSTGQVGAVFALEASRLARSCLDWHRLIELCALMQTLVIDEDGCYDPSDFNDGLLLGLKGTMAQAELHFIRARLQGGKLNKAKKGELHFPLPVGFTYDELGGVGLDPDQEVQGAVGALFATFRETGSAYAVVQQFARRSLRFPKRSYGGVWDGKLIWGRLTHGRVLGVLKNPAYAGVYVYGRYRTLKEASADGQIRARLTAVPMDSWLVTIKDHHPGYITWETFLENQEMLERNRTNAEGTLLTGPAREGLALLQGLLICVRCGHRLSVRYKGNGGIYPTYQCNWLHREGLSTTACMTLGCGPLDAGVARRALEVMQPAQIRIALQALQELERRDQAVLRQWQMRVERAGYEAQLAQKRYEEVDPSNRLVAATLERRWNEALLRLEEVNKQYAEFQQREALAATAEQKAQVLALANDFPRLWKASTTKPQDRKRMLRLLIKDITVEKISGREQVILHIRWQGGACEDLPVELPPSMADQVRYSQDLIEKIRELARKLPDEQIATQLNREGHVSAKGKSFTVSMVRWVRYRYQIPSPQLKRPEELTVQQVATKFSVRTSVVYYWIERGVIVARRRNRGTPYWITLDATKEHELSEWVRKSSRIRQRQPAKSPGCAVRSAV